MSEATSAGGAGAHTDGLAGGVLARLADRLGADPAPLRILFVVLVPLTGGLALLAYAIAWAVAGSAGRPARAGGGRFAELQLASGVALLVLATLLSFRQLGIWWSDAVVWPLVLAAGGATVLWRQSRWSLPTEPVAEGGARPGDSRPQRAEPAAGAGPFSSIAALYRGGFGIALVLGAALLVLSTNDALMTAGDAALTIVVVLVAIALILAPFLWRLGRNLAAERTERIRSQERADVAAHLHDSVLQTLALVQRRAGDPREIRSLARRQERELRGWLDGDRREGEGFAAALRRSAEAIEDAHRVAIEVVVVGDCPLDDAVRPLLDAAGEALTNAAKFAPEARITVYGEVGEQRAEVFVRDRGPGFDRDAIPADRRGVRESILGRMERHGGEASVRSAIGAGTEVELAVPRQRGSS